MRSIPTLVLLALMTVTVAMPAEAVSDIEYLGHKARREAELAYEALVSPPRPRPIPSERYADSDCASLYAERLSLQTDSYHYLPPLSEDPRVKVAGIISTVFTPALIYVGVASLMRLEEDHRIFHNQERIEAIARASAELRCWERN